jgi:hypothetical protein
MSDKRLKANTAWFHVFCDFVQSGEMAKMGLSTFGVLVAIKSHAALHDGQSCPAASTIAKYVGLSRRQVVTHLARLAELGYLQKESVGRLNRYQLTERIQITDEETGEPTALAHFPYVPLAVEEIRTQIKAFLASNTLPAGSPIVIQQLNIGIQIGEHNIQNIVVPAGAEPEAIADPRLREKVVAMIEKAKTRKPGTER